MLDKEGFRFVLAKAWRLRLTPQQIAIADGLFDTMARYGIEGIAAQKHFLGQVGHESGCGRYMEEIASGKEYEGRKDLGNTHKGDGVKYKGRGLIQLTGRANYVEYNQSDLPNEMEVNVVDLPECVARSTAMCCDVAGWFWRKHSLTEIANGPESFYDTCRHITKIINGGYNGFDNRYALTISARNALISSQ